VRADRVGDTVVDRLEPLHLAGELVRDEKPEATTTNAASAGSSAGVRSGDLDDATPSPTFPRGQTFAHWRRTTQPSDAERAKGRNSDGQPRVEPVAVRGRDAVLRLAALARGAVLHVELTGVKRP
jgi:hypothetical protein